MNGRIGMPESNEYFRKEWIHQIFLVFSIPRHRLDLTSLKKNLYRTTGRDLCSAMKTVSVRI